MDTLQDLLNKVAQIHSKAEIIYKEDMVPSSLKNEYRNKVSQYESMYDSVETMKQMTDSDDTMNNLINQQIEILRVRIKWELEWANRAAGYLI
ncbi:MAG: hypothetical protein K6F66_09660 [Pseudobutyrivibrio sp.]|nr:hypothetical protein [Pseudobutyrivibrio sp.]